MIRINKPVQLLEWGEGTSTINQNWNPIGQGKIRSAKRQQGITELVIEVEGAFEKKNLADNSIKIAQQGEGMAPYAIKWGRVKTRWGEVATGKLKAINAGAGKSQVSVVIEAATKIGKAILT